MRALRLPVSLALVSAINLPALAGEMDCPRPTPPQQSSTTLTGGSESAIDPLLEVTLRLLQDLLVLF